MTSLLWPWGERRFLIKSVSTLSVRFLLGTFEELMAYLRGQYLRALSLLYY